LFYEVRFGGLRISPARQRRLETMVGLLGRDVFAARHQ
jgi:hypothetical protein